jgi:Urocanase Rossmann-like domain
MNPDRSEPAEVYKLFRAVNVATMQLFDGQTGGRLLLVSAFDERASKLVVAANIAGYATLKIVVDGEAGRQGIRAGVCDFLVNSLDEALRILKNEIRKKQAVSVCLVGDREAVLAEIVERGLQPDLLDTTVAALVKRGAAVLHDSSDLHGETGVIWAVESEPARWLPQLDGLAIAALAGETAGGIDDPRIRWLRLAPRYLRRTLSGHRYVGLTEKETDRFEALVQEGIASGDLPDHVRILRAQ